MMEGRKQAERVETEAIFMGVQRSQDHRGQRETFVDSGYVAIPLPFLETDQ